jgi:hypothetical protein
MVHRDGSLPHCTLSPLLGARVEPGREFVCGGSTAGSQWAAESEQGPRNWSVLCPTGSSPGQMTSKHVATLTRTYVDAIEAASTPDLYCSCVAELNCMQELKNRPFRTAISGLK